VAQVACLRVAAWAAWTSKRRSRPGPGAARSGAPRSRDLAPQMQNPGNDAGVFVCADGTDAAIAQRTPMPIATPRLKTPQRYAEEKTSRPSGYPCYAHRAANMRSCVLTISKNNFARESQTEPTVRFFAARVTSGLDQGSPKKTRSNTELQALVTLASVAGNAFA
jgi:hypothetical protein